MERYLAALPDQFSRDTLWEIDFCRNSPRASGVLHCHQALRGGQRRMNLLEAAEMGFDEHFPETRRLRMNPGHDRQQVVVGVRAPGVGVRPCRFRTLGPGSQPKGDHVVPGLEQAEIVVRHPGLLQCASQIKAKIISCSSHRRNRTCCRKSWVACGENLRERSLVLVSRNNIKPDAQNVGVLTEMLLRGRVC